MAEDYQIQNMYRYTRKSYKNNARRVSIDEGGINIEGNIETAQCTPRSDDIAVEPACNCDIDTEGDIVNILHKKCPVITLAEQQLKRLLDETDNIFCDNTRCCRSIYDFLWVCQEIVRTQNKSLCFILLIMLIMLTLGVLLGAASCGTHLGRLNSPILKCLDRLFTSDIFMDSKEFYGII